MLILDSVEKDYASIEKAAQEFYQMILDDDVRKSIALASEMSGLQLLRASKEISQGYNQVWCCSVPYLTRPTR